MSPAALAQASIAPFSNGSPTLKSIEVLLLSLPAVTVALWLPCRVFVFVHLVFCATSFPRLLSAFKLFAPIVIMPPSWLFPQHSAILNHDSFVSSKTQQLSKRVRSSTPWFYSASQFWLLKLSILTAKDASFVALSIVLEVALSAQELVLTFRQQSQLTTFVSDLPSFAWVKWFLFSKTSLQP